MYIYIHICFYLLSLLFYVYIYIYIFILYTGWCFNLVFTFLRVQLLQPYWECPSQLKSNVCREVAQRDFFEEPWWHLLTWTFLIIPIWSSSSRLWQSGSQLWVGFEAYSFAMEDPQLSRPLELFSILICSTEMRLRNGAMTWKQEL